MNPLFERKLFFVRYVVFYAMFSAVYAIALGLPAGLDAEYIAIDWAVTALVSGFEGLVLWSILKYGAEATNHKVLKRAYYFTVGVLFTGVAIGLESAVMSMVMAGEFPLFVQTLPGRSLVLALVYASFVLYYVPAARTDDDAEAPDPDAKPDRTKADAIERITIRGGQKIKVIAVGEIAYLQAEGDYVAIVTAEGRFLKEQTMKYFEENLPLGAFVRVHRSFIVSIPHISRIEQSGREHAVVLRDGTRIRISDGGYKQLRGTLGL